LFPNSGIASEIYEKTGKLDSSPTLQIIETGFAEQFYASHRVGPASICFKISASTD